MFTGHDDRATGQQVSGPSSHRHLLVFVAVVAVLLMLAAAWRWTPLNQYLSLDTLSALLIRFESPWTRGVAAVLAIWLASLLMVPLTLLAVVAGIVLGGTIGFVCAVMAAMLSAAAGFWLGHTLSRNAVKRLTGGWLQRLNAGLANQGLITVAAARLVPAAPFTVFNLVAGASKLRFRPFILGSLLAFAPGIGALTLFSDRVRAAFMNPTPGTVAIVAGLGVVILVTGWLVRQRLADH